MLMLPIRGAPYIGEMDRSVAPNPLAGSFGKRRTGALVGRSEELMVDKAEFGTSRARRWFGRDWVST
jgi:sulfide:quinone oxidoreductase